MIRTLKKKKREILATAKIVGQVNGRLMPDAAFSYCPTVLKSHAGKYYPQLVYWSAINLKEFSLDFSNGIGSLNLKGMGPAAESRYKNTHGCFTPTRRTQSQNQFTHRLPMDLNVDSVGAIFDF